MLLQLLFCINAASFSQENMEQNNLLNRIGLGGFKMINEQIYSGSFGHYFGEQSEMEFHLYYHTYFQAKEFIIGTTINRSFWKKITKFQLLYSLELAFNYYWYPRINSNLTTIRYGSFLLPGIQPQYKISNHIQVAIEMKIGTGYQWSKNDELYHQDSGIHFVEKGWHFRTIGGLKFYYNF